MKCTVKLRVIDGLTTNQQIYLLQHIITQLMFHISRKQDDPQIIQDIHLRKIDEKWCIEINVNPSYVNTFMHIVNGNHLSLLSGDIYEFVYSE